LYHRCRRHIQMYIMTTTTDAQADELEFMIEEFAFHLAHRDKESIHE
jgi:hypothetical protein